MRRIESKHIDKIRDIVEEKATAVYLPSLSVKRDNDCILIQSLILNPKEV